MLGDVRPVLGTLTVSIQGIRNARLFIILFAIFGGFVRNFGRVVAILAYPNLNFLVRISSGWVGVFHVNGVGAKKFGISFEAEGNQTFLPGYPGGSLLGYPGGARKV